jgi:hypothetical protein
MEGPMQGYNEVDRKALEYWGESNFGIVGVLGILFILFSVFQGILVLWEF